VRPLARAGGRGGRPQPITDASTASEDDIAKESQSPIGNLTILPFENYTNFGVGPHDGTQNVLEFEPVVPFHITPDWNIIARAVSGCGRVLTQEKYGWLWTRVNGRRRGARRRRKPALGKVGRLYARFPRCMSAAASAPKRDWLSNLKAGAGMTVRASFFGWAAAAVLAAAVFLPGPFAAAQKIDMNVVDQPGYQPTPEEEQLSGAYEKQEVFFRANEAPGTIIIDTSQRFLYLVQPNNRALRYGIGVGRDGFQWSGLQKISRKQEWPDWRPPPEMIERQPYLPRFMAGGAGNPLGARAMYLGQTVYRIHGTNQPQTIGHAISSGCFRLVNDDVTDLYDRVPVGTKVIIKQAVAL